jgi:hypothetical protein
MKYFFVRCFFLLALIFIPNFALAQDTISYNPTHFQKFKDLNKTETRLHSDQLISIEPESANPRVSFLPIGTEPDWVYWRMITEMRSWEKSKNVPTFSRAIVNVVEVENNSSFATAQPLTGIGTDNGEDERAVISGGHAISNTITMTALAQFAEDDGSILLSSDIDLDTNEKVTVAGSIGDGAQGSSGTGFGDFDFFTLTGLTGGELVIVDLDTVPLPGALDSFITLWDSSGILIDFNDDDPFVAVLDSYLEFRAPAAGDYYVCVGGFGSFAPFDPFNSASGFGAASEGTYTISITKQDVDRDIYSIELEAGDVIGAQLTSTGRDISLYDPSETLRIRSFSDSSSFNAPLSPLPGGGIASLSYVVEIPGTYYLEVFGSATTYTFTVHVARPGKETDGSFLPQQIFLDFDGGDLDNAIFEVSSPAVVTISPLSAFLVRWGLAASQEDAVIDAIVAEFTNDVEDDLRDMGLNPFFAVEILNSRDDSFPVETTNVTHLFIGGTIAELGINTIGIAQSIDVGNYDAADKGIVLLDLLSESPGVYGGSLNAISHTPGTDFIEFIGQVVGNITAHEAGHTFGNYHTDTTNSTFNIMDQGGSLGIYGIGPDGIYGTADDSDVDFVADIYAANEGFVGREDTLNTTAFALSTLDPDNIPLQVWPIALGMLAAGCWRLRRRK